MRSSDFRLGNSVWYDVAKYKSKKKDGEFVILEAVDDPNVVISVALSDIMPIKLTPSLLLEVGFAETYLPNSAVPRYTWFDPYENILFHLDEWDDEGEEFVVHVQQDRFADSESICLCFLRYYHQWENLFYMVNNREIGEKPKNPR